MLKILRKKNVSKIILWIIAIVIIISFGFFGTANYLSAPGDSGPRYAGKIHGRTVSIDDFVNAYEHTRVQAMMRYGENFAKLSEFLNLEGETWDRIILLQEANQRNIKVTDQEVVDAIKNFAFFQRNGNYDTLLYTDVVRYVFRSKPRDFEEGIRESLQLKKLYEQETFLVTLTPEELHSAYKQKNEKTQVSYVWFPAEKFKDQTSVDDSQTLAFYEARKNEFMMPNSIDVDYLAWEFPPNVSDTSKAAITTKAQEIYKDITASGLEEAAKKHGLTVQTSGFFSLEQPNLKLGWPYEALLKAFSLDLKQTSELLETPKGIYVLKLKEKRAAYLPEFAEVKDRLKEMMQIEEAKKFAQEQAQKALEQMKEQLPSSSMEFSRLAKNLGFEIDQTPLFARGEYLPKIGISKTFQEAAFALSDEQKLSDVVEIGKGYGFLYREQYQPVNEEDFNKGKDALAESLLAEQKGEAFNDFLTQLRLKAKLVDNISKEKQRSN